MIAPKPQRGTLGMIKRLITVPLTPFHGTAWNPFSRSQEVAENDNANAEKGPAVGREAPQLSVHFSHTTGSETEPPEPRSNEHFSIHTRSSECVNNNARLSQVATDRAGQSFFSWSQPNIPFPTAKRDTRNGFVRFSRPWSNARHDSVFSADGEPVKHRSVRSWVANQQQRHPKDHENSNGRYSKMPGDTDGSGIVPAMPAKGLTKANSKDLKFGFPRKAFETSSKNAETPRQRDYSPSSPETPGTPFSPYSPQGSPQGKVAMEAAGAQRPQLVTIPSRQLSQKALVRNESDSSDSSAPGQNAVANPTTLVPLKLDPTSSTYAPPSSVYSTNDRPISSHPSVPPPPIRRPIPAAQHLDEARQSRAASLKRTMSQNTSTTSRTTLSIFRAHPGEKWEYRGPKLAKGDRRIDSGVLDRLRKAGWGSLTRDSQ
ncbi:MAG: hypothetical protein Q9227_005555 [Pyrenula ochraceoflavens]